MDNIQLTLESSTTTLSLNSDSIYLNPELDGLAGLPEIRTTSGVNAGYNGGWTSAQFYDARLITIRGVIANSDIATVEARRKALVGLLGQGRKEELTLHFVTAGGQSYVLNCRTISCEMALSGLATKQEFLIQLRADDPLIYDDGTLATEAIVNVRRALGGFQIDFGLPLYIGGGVNETLVENGNETVYPVINLYGPLHSPTIINQTTNQQMQVLTDLDYTLTWVNPVEVTGDYILVTNETDKESPLSSVELLGNTVQNTLSGKNLYDVSTLGTGTYVTVDSNGWITINRDNSAGTSTVYSNAWTSNLAHLATSTRYDVFMEVKSVSGDGGELAVTSTASGSGQFDSWQTFQITSLSAGTVYVRNPTTKSSFSGISNGLRTTLTLPAGKKCSITFRLSVLAYGTETSSTFSYEPYCGGIPAPNPTYPIAVQTTTGEQVIEMRGKNLLKLPNAGTISGITYAINSDGTFNLHGTNSANYEVLFIYYIGPTEFQSTNYTLSANKALPDGAGVRLEIYSGTTWKRSFVSVNNSRQLQTATPDFTDANRVRVAVTVGSGKTVDIDNLGVMLELGSTASDFEPYQSQSYEVNLGKNLFDKDNAEIVHIYNANSESKANASAWSIILPCEPNRAYTYSNTAPSQMKSDSSIGFYEHKPTGAGIAKLGIASVGQNASATFTTPAGTHWMLIYYNWASSDKPAAYAGMMIELGSTATDYAAYFTPIELCKLGDYQDKIYKSGDDWYVRKEVGKYNLATATWTIEHTANSYRFQMPAINDILPTTNQQVGKIMSNGYKPATASQSWAYTSGFCIAQQNDKKIIIYDERYNQSTSQSDFRTWIANSTMVLYYALATATDTQITNQTLIDQLDALASSTLFVGVNNIALVPSGGAKGELSIDYFSAYTEERDIVVIDSQARTITKNGADIYYLKADGSEFPTLAPGENTLYLTSEQTSDEGYAEIKFKQGYLSI